jgi:hypothetical protein
VEGEKGVGRGEEGKGATNVLTVTRLNGFTTVVDGGERGPKRGRVRRSGGIREFPLRRGPRGIMVQAGSCPQHPRSLLHSRHQHSFMVRYTWQRSGAMAWRAHISWGGNRSLASLLTPTMNGRRKGMQQLFCSLNLIRTPPGSINM